MVSVSRTDKPIRSGLLMVLAAEAALVLGLHWIGSMVAPVPVEGLVSWFRTVDPTEALVALARLAGLAIGYWLLTTTVLFAVSHHLGLDPITRALHWVTLPVIRQLVQGVTAVSLTGASLFGPSALAAAPAFAMDIVSAQDDTTTTVGVDPNGSSPYVPDAAGWPTAGSGSGFWLPSDGSRSDGSGPAAVTPVGHHTVVRGEHFWSIAENHLRRSVGRDVTEDEVCRYWVRVVEANRATIRSGDPDLIYPDERISLPSVFDDEDS